MDIKKIEKLATLLKENDLKAIEVEEKDERIYIESHSKEGQVSEESNQLTANQSIPAAKDSNQEFFEIRSPQMGVFYTQPEKDSTETFVNLGDHVDPGQEVGLIEAMKAFNPITTEKGGIVEEIKCSNGETVDYDQVLMVIRAEEV